MTQLENDVQIIKSSIVELKQRLDRIEHHCKMPEAGPRPGTPYFQHNNDCEDFRWGEISPGSEQRAASRKEGYDYAMTKVKEAINNEYPMRLPCENVTDERQTVERVLNNIKSRLGL